MFVQPLLAICFGLPFNQGATISTWETFAAPAANMIYGIWNDYFIFEFWYPHVPQAFSRNQGMEILLYQT
jgi:hypothetical protein